MSFVKILPITLKCLTKCLSEIRLNEDSALLINFMSVLWRSTIVVWIIYCFFSCQHSVRFVLQIWIDGFCWLCLLGLNKVRWHDTSFFNCFFILTFIIMRIWWVQCCDDFCRLFPLISGLFHIINSGSSLFSPSPSQMKHKLQLC